VSDVDRSEAGTLQETLQAGPTDELNGLLAERPSVEREGLPRSYKMRAEAHYVDHLEARRSAPAIRVIPTRHIDSPAGSSSTPGAALVQSIATHGILQPLLVRRQNGRYHVIAGRQRLAAAIAASLAEVPCFTYDVDDAEAAALAEADNLRASIPGNNTPLQPQSSGLGVLRAVSRDLSAIDAATTLLRRSGGEALSKRVAADLIQAQTWRATWMSNAALLAGTTDTNGPAKPLGSIIDRVKAGFEAQSRLTSLHLDYSVAPAAASIALDDDLVTMAITGCVFATLAWVEDCEDARVEVRVDVPNPRTLRVEVVQRMAPVPEEAVRCLQDPGLRPWDMTPALGLLTARSVATRYGGAFDLTAIGGRGSVIRITFSKPDGY
jgi:hypothetical protein